MIFNNLKAGWCDFVLEGFTGTPSYITSVPTDVLEGVLSYYRSGSMAITFDEEGSWFILVASNCIGSCYIISVKDGEKVSPLKISPDDLAKRLYKEITSREDEWVSWLSENNRDEDYYRDYIKLLKDEIYHAKHG